MHRVHDAALRGPKGLRTVTTSKLDYIHPCTHGCLQCRGWAQFEQRDIPDVFRSAGQALRAPAGAWADRFHQCVHCKAWWCFVFDPKDLMYRETACPPHIAAALQANASLDEAWPFLFGPAPIDELFEKYLYTGSYDPQRALDLLTDHFNAPGAAPAEQADVLRMLERLLTLQNPGHRSLQQRQGWVWTSPDPARFAQPILHFERLLGCDRRYVGHARHGLEQMQSLRTVLERNARGTLRILRGEPPLL